ncbi:unnamed protein product [Lampetra planeri]
MMGGGGKLDPRGFSRVVSPPPRLFGSGVARISAAVRNPNGRGQQAAPQRFTMGPLLLLWRRSPFSQRLCAAPARPREAATAAVAVACPGNAPAGSPDDGLANARKHRSSRMTAKLLAFLENDCTRGQRKSPRRTTAARIRSAKLPVPSGATRVPRSPLRRAAPEPRYSRAVDTGRVCRRSDCR